MSKRLPIGAEVFIYVIECQPFLKVGIAISPEQRLSDMQIGNPFPLEIRAAVPVRHEVAGAAEHIAHLALAGARHRNEWFLCNAERAIDAVRTAVDLAEQDWKAGSKAHEFEAHVAAVTAEAESYRLDFLAKRKILHAAQDAAARQRYVEWKAVQDTIKEQKAAWALTRREQQRERRLQRIRDQFLPHDQTATPADCQIVE